MADLEQQMKDFRLTTAQIYYHLPDHGSLIQEYIWQDYDLAPQFPILENFLQFWTREIDGKLHSVYVAKKEVITPGECHITDWDITLQ